MGAPPGGAPAPGAPPMGGPAPGAPAMAAGMAPGQPGMGAPPGGAPMMPAGGGPPGAHGPIGTTRNPIMVLIISAICFIYFFIQLWGMINELKAFRQKDDLSPIMFFIPVLNIIQLWGLPEKVLEAKQMAGVPNPTVPHPIMYLFLGLYFIPADLNEIWQAAGGGQPA